jgi:hypothetical protein
MSSNKAVPAAMRIRVTDPKHTDDLISYLGESADAVVARIGATELEAQLLGSYHTEAMRAQLCLRLRRWETRQRARGSMVGVHLL